MGDDLSLDVAKFCQEWIKTQDVINVRPLSPESKEALDSGTLAKESIPVFYLDADKKIQNKEHKSNDHKKVSKHHGKKKEKKHHKVKSLDKKKDKKVSKEKT